MLVSEAVDEPAVVLGSEREVAIGNVFLEGLILSLRVRDLRKGGFPSG
jgi:hypothetical protein